MYIMIVQGKYHQQHFFFSPDSSDLLPFLISNDLVLSLGMLSLGWPIPGLLASLRLRSMSQRKGYSTFLLSFTEVAKYLIPVISHHFLICSWLTFRCRSILFPTRTILTPSVLAWHRGYHWLMRLSKVAGLVSSNTNTIPWQPLKQVDTIDLKRSWPAVSQMYSLIIWSFVCTFFILKSMVVTCVSFMGRYSPSVYFQNSVVLPTFGSPIMMNLKRFSDPNDKNLSSMQIILLYYMGLLFQSQSNPSTKQGDSWWVTQKSLGE